MVPAVLMLALMAAPAAVDAHGWLEDPPARQYCNPPDYSVTFSAGNGAHGMNYLPGDVKNTAGGVPGLCGDPFQGKPDSAASNYAGKPCDPTRVYKAGGTMKTEVHVIANHGGWWEMSICDSKDISQACFDKNILKTTETGSERWYIMSASIESPNVRNPEKYTMEWQLPAGLTCEHCVVQWSWWTAHRCTFPCEKEVCGFYADGLNKIALPHKTHPLEICASRSPAKGQDPQMFRNCADIKITGDGSGQVSGPQEAVTDDSYEPTDDEETLDMGDDDDTVDGTDSYGGDDGGETGGASEKHTTGTSTTASATVTTSDGDGNTYSQSDEDSSGGDGGFGFASAFASTGGDDSGGGDAGTGESTGSLKSLEKEEPATAVYQEEEDPPVVPPQWSTRGPRRPKDRTRKPRGKKEKN